MAALYDALQSFGEEHFGTAELGDRRRTRRLVELANRMVHHPGGTLPHKVNRPSELKALYRLMEKETVTHASILAAHRRRTRARIEQYLRLGQTVLLVHDGTELDYSNKFSLEGLGQIGNGGVHVGYICHNSLAVVAGSRAVIGLANQILHCRPPKTDQRQTVAERRVAEDRESRLWVDAVRAIGPFGMPGAVIDVCDRGSDTFEFLDHEVSNDRRFLVRSAQDRVITNDRGRRGYLHACARQLSEWGRRSHVLQANLARIGRKTEVAVAAAAVTVLAPTQKRGEHGDDPLPLWVVRVWEPEPPAGAKSEAPLEWILLTNVPIHTLADAWRVVDWYGCRPVIEEYHKGMKTGCQIESLQFTHVDRLQPTIALLSVVTLTLLSLRDLGRRPEAKELRATDFLHHDYIEVLSHWRYGEVRPALTLHDFTYALGHLGGHQNRKRDRAPGWLVLWRGWELLNAMVLGADLERRRERKCG